MVSPIIPKMGTRDIATSKTTEPLSPPARRLKFSNMGRQMVYRVRTSRLLTPAEERLSPGLCQKRDGKVSSWWVMALYVRCYLQKNPGKGPMRKTGSLSSCSRVEDSLSPLCSRCAGNPDYYKWCY
jgi:hypothetical protein